MADAFAASADACKAEVDADGAPANTCEADVKAVACAASQSWAVLRDAWKAVKADSKSSSAGDGTKSAELAAAAKATAAWNASVRGRASSASSAVSRRHSLAPPAPSSHNYSTLFFSGTISDLPDDVFRQILVRLPPHPSSILRASLAQKSWMDVMGSKDFRTLTLSHNRGMPLLGFFTNNSHDLRFITDHDLDQAMFQKLNNLITTPTTNTKPYVLGCRSGRVLIHYPNGGAPIVVWDPISGSETVIKAPSDFNKDNISIGTILCSKNHGQMSSQCCSNFLVVWIESEGRYVKVKRYSSELGAWEDCIERRVMLAELDHRPATLIGGNLYWQTMKSRYIMAFDNVTRELCFIECPHETHDIFRRNLHIAKGHNGDVAIVAIRDFTLQTWSSARSSTCKWKAWVPHVKVEVDSFLGLDRSWAYGAKHAVRLLCAFEDRKMLVVVWAKEGVFELDLIKMKCNKKFKSPKRWCNLHPYLMTPATDVIRSAKSRKRKERTCQQRS